MTTFFERGATEHYDDPRYYDQAYRSRRVDVDFYAGLAAEVDALLELGVGTGRCALACARTGARVVGVDLSSPMLEHAEKRLSRERKAVKERVTLHTGDFREVRLNERFPLVIAPFNTLMHMYTPDDCARTFATIREHLAPGGRLVFDVLMPDLEFLGASLGETFQGRPVSLRGQKFGYQERFDYDPFHQVHTTYICLTSEDDPDDVRLTRLTHRYFFPQELLALMEAHGFEVDSLHGGFANEDVEHGSESLVVRAH